VYLLPNYNFFLEVTDVPHFLSLSIAEFYCDCLDMFDYIDHQSHQPGVLQPRHLVPIYRIPWLNYYVGEGIFEEDDER
jgi:hypothetical protein